MEAEFHPVEFVEDLSRTFRVLSDPTRIRILHLLLGDGEHSVGDAAKDFVFYRVVDPCAGELLHRAHCLARDGKDRRRKK